MNDFQKKHFTLTKLYADSKKLFADNPRANGCYKIRVTWKEILSINPNLTMVPLTRPFYHWPLAFTEEHIVSYMQGATQKEFLNNGSLEKKSDELAITSRDCSKIL